MAQKRSNLRTIFADTALPDEMPDLADLSGHITPVQLYKKLDKYGLLQTPVYCHYLKPAYHDQVNVDVDSISLLQF